MSGGRTEPVMHPPIDRRTFCRLLGLAAGAGSIATGLPARAAEGGCADPAAAFRTVRENAERQAVITALAIITFISTLLAAW